MTPLASPVWEAANSWRSTGVGSHPDTMSNSTPSAPDGTVHDTSIDTPSEPSAAEKPPGTRTSAKDDGADDCPKLSSPQHTTELSALAPHECHPPAATDKNEPDGADD